MIRQFTAERAAPPAKRQLSFIRSENKNRSVWQYLKRYQSVDFVRMRLQVDYPNMSSSLREKKARHIADCIRQGGAYFASASASDPSIKPLILYYGMLSLAKALMLLGDNNLTLDDDVLKQEGLNTHGLSHGTKNPTDKAIRDDDIKILEEFCYTSSRNNTSTVFSLLHECWSNAKPSSGLRFEVGDLASMHPSSWRSYADYTGRAPKYFSASSTFRTTARGHEQFLSFKGTFDFQAYQNAIPAGAHGNTFFEGKMPRLAILYDRDTHYSPYGYVSKQIPTSLEEYQAVYRTSTGESYTMQDANVGIPLHPIEVEFVMLFILGSLTRYAPQKWLRNVMFESGDSMFVIEGFINSVVLSFPKMVLEELDNRDYTFTGDLAYWG
jgi:hypothetical protein